MAKNQPRKGLGRGLSALMADVEPLAPTDQSPPTRVDAKVPIDRLRPNPDQPRKTFTEEQLSDLSNSVREKGIIQPLIVRRIPGDSLEYEIVAGERRWRAAQRAQIHEVPVIIRDYSDAEVLEIAIIENIQRADLNPVEEAAGYRQLMDRFGHTQEKMAEALGKSRSHIANLLRLLTLPDEVLGYLQRGELTAGHARALVTLDDPVAAAREILKKGLSVREAESLGKPKKKKAPKVTPEKDADTRALEGDLSAALGGMRVTLDHPNDQGAGTVTIKYKSLEELDDLCARLSGTG
ncbi:MAG: ParB/RepB/Spo0J family partition protein [Rhodobacteraceae bacterium]|nr:ParB/RepB/Spo0J family partition protein [Paracoccaceae bacterium]